MRRGRRGRETEARVMERKGRGAERRVRARIHCSLTYVSCRFSSVSLVSFSTMEVCCYQLTVGRFPHTLLRHHSPLTHLAVDALDNAKAEEKVVLPLRVDTGKVSTPVLALHLGGVKADLVLKQPVLTDTVFSPAWGEKGKKRK